jgi:hypothetical protein
MAIRALLVALLISSCAISMNATRPRFRWSQPSGRTRSVAMSKILRRDAARDASTRSVRLSRMRSVARYTTGTRARLEARGGIAAGSHFTARLRRGRPMSATNARRSFGLPRKPSVRESVLLRKGTQVRFNKAIHGRPGIGEITTVRRIPRESIRQIARLKR